MKNKLLIYSQDYELTKIHYIIDKNDIEDYINHSIKGFVEKLSKRTNIYEYVSHHIYWEHNYVSIKFLRHAYTVLNASYKEQDHYEKISFIQLDKMPYWEAQPKALSESLPVFKHEIPTKILPTSLELNGIEFSQLQIQKMSPIISTPIYTNILEKYTDTPWCPTKKLLVKQEYNPIELTLMATIEQVAKIRSVFSASTIDENPNTKRKPETLKIIYKDKTFFIDGFLRDLSYTVELEYPDYLPITLGFTVNNVNIN